MESGMKIQNAAEYGLNTCYYLILRFFSAADYIENSRFKGLCAGQKSTSETIP